MNTINKIKILLGITALPLLAKADEWADYRFSLTTSSIELTDLVSTRTNLEARSLDLDGVYYVRAGQQFYTKLGSKWKLGTHGAFENARVADQWFHTYKIDLELNPATFKLTENGPKISMRNRWELRWRQNQGDKVFHRFRQRTYATWNLNRGPFTAYKIGNEVFYEEHKGKISMNRFYPIALDAKLTEKLKVTYYGMYQSNRIGTSSRWTGLYVFGANFGY